MLTYNDWLVLKVNKNIFLNKGASLLAIIYYYELKENSAMGIAVFLCGISGIFSLYLRNRLSIK